MSGDASIYYIKIKKGNGVRMKKVTSLLLMLVMCITLISPTQVKEAQAAEADSVSTWAIPELMYGDTYGIYPLTWYEKKLTTSISQGKFRVLYYGVRGKLVSSDCAVEKRFEAPVIDNSITVKEALEAFYLLLSNYDYTVDLGLTQGIDAVSYMQLIGVYTGQNGEQSLNDVCSMEQAMVMATRIVAIMYEALDASSKGFLWEVKSGENTVYLLGSIHLASNQIYPYSNELWTAFYKSDALFAEVNFYNQADFQAYSQLAVYTDGTTLKDHLSADTYQKVIETAALLGIPEEIAAYCKPWALYITFQNFLATDNTGADKTSAQLGIDFYLMTNAVLNQKPIYAVEGLEKQGQILDSFSDGLQEYLLSTYSTLISDMLNGVTEVSKSDVDDYIDSLYDAWKAGDIEEFKALTVEDEDEAFKGELSDEVKAYNEEYQLKLLTLRDDAMAEYIDQLLKSEGSNTYFVVLGAGHYISNYSVIDRLEKMGYTATQIK